MAKISRADYAAIFGPTAGDQIRLGDTDLWIEIEQDLTFGGEESVFGGGKSIRESMNQSDATSADGALDTVITNVTSSTTGGSSGPTSGIAAAGSSASAAAATRQIADGVDPALVIGPGTDVISGEGKILTAGGFDSHVHFLSPSQIVEALAAGLTTLGGGGTGPSEGSKATTVTPGRLAPEAGPPGAGRVPGQPAAARQGQHGLGRRLRGAGPRRRGRLQGARGLGIDPGRDRRGADAAPTSGACRSRCTPTRSTRPASWPRTIDAFRGRSISAFHVEGAGGGHAPDILTIAGLPNVLPGSTNPTLPHTVNTVAEHLDMLMVCHHLNPAVPEDLAFAESRIRATTIAAEDHLHDLGAISITSSDAQAMGRIGEVITRTWQVAHVMKHVRGELSGGLPADNFRARRYVAKYTINPAVAHGVDHEIGSVEVGKLADLVLWDPKFFGVSPSVVIKGGGIVVGALGDPNASIPTPQPVLLRPALYAGSAPTLSQSYVAPAALENGLGRGAGARPHAGGDQADPRRRQGGHDQQRRAAARSTSTRSRTRSPSTAT